jgi:hypothetical protein
VASRPTRSRACKFPSSVIDAVVAVHARRGDAHHRVIASQIR